MNNRELFLRHQAQTSPFPMLLEIERSYGSWLFDIEGKRYLDLISGISVSHLGHGNENVKKAIINQLNIHQHVMVYGEFVQCTPAHLAKELCNLLPASLDSVYLLNSGAEATDVSLKLAKRVTGRSKIIACRNAYHGSTHAALSLNSEEQYKQPFRPLLPGVSFIDFNQIDTLKSIDGETACVITEVIQGEAGYIPAQKDFLAALRKRCDETGAMLIFDEIQSGMGKTGRMFAFEHYDTVPDVLLLGKALGAGMPIGAVIANRTHMYQLAEFPMLGHITTFGGHPVVAAAALAGIQELKTCQVIERVESKDKLFRERLIHRAIKNISGKGLMLAVELDSFENNLRVIQLAVQYGLIVDWFLFAGNKIRISPPLTITNEEIEFACEMLLKALNEVYGVSSF